jgi:serine/threonine-protein kinase
MRPEVPREIDAIVRKMGAKDPHERYPSAREVLAAMHPWLPLEQWQALGIALPEPPPPEKPAPKKRGFFARLFGR